MIRQPRKPLLQLSIFPRKPRLFESKCNQPRRIPVAQRFLGRSIVSLPVPRHRSETPPSVRLLLAERFVDDGLLAFRIEQSRKFRRSPQQHNSIAQTLCRVFAVQVFAQRLQIVLDFWSRAVVLWSCSNGNGRQCRSVVVRVVRLPRLILESQPQPGPLFIARGLLLGPHILERRARVVAQRSTPPNLAGVV